MKCANFHKKLMSKGEIANISKLVRFLINLIQHLMISKVKNSDIEWLRYRQQRLLVC